jgi:hypothetical protein
MWIGSYYESYSSAALEVLHTGCAVFSYISVRTVKLNKKWVVG